MTPPAEPANPPIAAGTVVPAELLQDGEVVILAVRPSRWFVLLASWPVLVATVLIAAGAHLAEEAFGQDVPRKAVFLFCAAVAFLRIVIAAPQWLARLYVLTDRRVLCIRGVLRDNTFQCPLKGVCRTVLSTTFFERAFGLGSLFFVVGDNDEYQGDWVNVPHPTEVEQIVNEAVRRARSR